MIGSFSAIARVLVLCVDLEVMILCSVFNLFILHKNLDTGIQDIFCYKYPRTPN